MSHGSTILDALHKLEAEHRETVRELTAQISTQRRKINGLTRERDKYKGQAAEYRARAATYRRDLIAARNAP